MLVKNLTKSDIKTLKLALILSIILSVISIVLSFIINFWGYFWFLSILIGYLASSICYIKLANVVVNITNGVYQKPRMRLITNNLTSLLIYFLVLLLSVLVDFLNIFLCFIGIITIKIVLIIQYARKSNKEV